MTVDDITSSDQYVVSVLIGQEVSSLPPGPEFLLYKNVNKNEDYGNPHFIELSFSFIR